MILGFLERVSKIGIWRSKNSLQQTRQKTLNVFCLLFIVVAIFVALSRLYLGNYVNFIVNLAGAGVVASAIWCSAKGWYTLAEGIASTTLVSLCFALIFSGLVPLERMMPQLALSMALFIFVIETRWHRAGYILYTLILTGLIFHQKGTPPLQICTFVFQIGGFAVAFNYLVKFTERQDQRLNASMNRLAESTRALQAANTQLSARNEELVAFAHIMSHDLKAPLTAIQLSAEIMLEEQGVNDPQSENLEMLNHIKSATVSMNLMIKDILEYSKLSSEESIPMEPLPLNSVVDLVRPFFEMDISRGDARLDVGSLPKVTGNKETLRTVFQNLISNSFKYQPKEKAGHVPTVRIWSKEEEDMSCVYFQDNGIGIAEDFREHLFTPFRRSREGEYSGTGLGMSICQQIILKHQGSIALWKTSGEGSTFVVRFPMSFTPT